MKNDLENLFDPLGMTSSLMKIHEAWKQNSAELLSMLTRLYSEIQAATTEELARMISENGNSGQSPADPKASLMKQVRSYSRLANRYHNTYGNWLKDYASLAPGLEKHEKRRSTFWTGQVINALAPSNYFWTNPSAVGKFLESKGESLRSGLKNWLDDVDRGDDLIKIADHDAFKVGENLATTPGYVVFRNELIELIQYAPTTRSTHEIPIVFIQPWINKYYILDLTEEKSLVRYLQDQGFTVFMVSWKNPTPEMGSLSFEDYMLKGALKAVETAREICRSKHAHAVGYCIGGTVLSTLMAWLNRGSGHKKHSIPIKDWTLFASMVDYSSPGELGVYIHEKSISKIERLMEREGYLDGKYMGLAFRLLRSDSLIWRYYAHNYLQGGVPPKSDFLYWNSDLTRLPASMCSFYLRELYLKNKLVKEDGISLAGRSISLRRIRQPLYAVGAEQDHICPWKQTYRICNLVGGPVRYTLTTEGHITGIVNPPSERSKRMYWTGEAVTEGAADDWLPGLEQRQGSWWTDWRSWLSERCGSMVDPPSMGSKAHPPLTKAPGTYVLNQ